MIIVIQYTISDFRNFIDFDEIPLPFPSWPFPQVNEFVKSVGQVKNRRLGGINNWVGESSLCFAKQAIKIRKWYSFCKSLPYKITLKYRRFYFDGYASGKYEIGFIVIPNKGLVDIESLIKELLTLEARIKIPGEPERINQLGRISNDLRDQYFFATKSSEKISQAKQWNHVKYLKCSEPRVFIEKNIAEKTHFRLSTHSVFIEKVDSKINHKYLFFNGKYYPVWIIENCRSLLISKRLIRDLRLILLRFISSRVTILEILKAIDKGLISPAPFSKESDLLQQYLIDNIKNVLRVEKEVESTELVMLIREIEDRLNAGTNSALFEKLRKTINVRPQVLHKVYEFLEFGVVLHSFRDQKVEFVMKKNQITITGGNNINVNLSEGGAIQNIVNDNKTSETLKNELVELILKIENEMRKIQPNIDSNQYNKITQSLNLLKSSSGNGDVIDSKKLKGNANSFVKVLNSIGEIGSPVLKIVGEILCLV